MRPFRSNALKPTERDESRVLPLNALSRKGELTATQQAKAAAMSAAGVAVLSDDSIPIGKSDQSLVGFLRDEFESDVAGREDFKRRVQAQAARVASTAADITEAQQKAHAIILGAVFQRWLHRPGVDEDDTNRKKTIRKELGITAVGEAAPRRSPEAEDRMQDVADRILASFTSSGWKYSGADRSSIILAAIRKQQKITQAEAYAGPSATERSLYRKRGKLLGMYNNFLREARLSESPAALSQFMELRRLELEAKGSTPKKIDELIKEETSLILGPVRREVSYDAALPGQEDEGEEGDTFLSQFADEASISPDMTRRMAYWGTVDNRLLLDLAAVVYSFDASKSDPCRGLPKEICVFYRDLPATWRAFVNTLFLSVTKPDFQPKRVLSSATEALKKAEKANGSLTAEGKLVPPDVPPRTLVAYGFTTSSFFWQGLLVTYADLPLFSSNPRKNPMSRPYVLYPRVTRYGGVNSGTMPVHVPGVPFTQFPNVFLANPDGEMRSTTARFGGKCRATGEHFEAGTTIYKHDRLGWCTEEGIALANTMSDDEIDEMVAARPSKKNRSSGRRS